MISFTRNIWIRKEAQCCRKHLVKDPLKTNAINIIKPSTILYEELDSSDVRHLLNKSQILFKNNNKTFHFDDPRDLTDDKYQLLTSLSSDDINEFVGIVSLSSVRNTSSQSMRTVIDENFVLVCRISS